MQYMVSNVVTINIGISSRNGDKNKVQSNIFIIIQHRYKMQMKMWSAFLNQKLDIR